MDITSLQLADRIAKAVLTASRPRGSLPYGNAPAIAVLDTLREHSVWFCHVEQDAEGVIDGEVAPVRLPFEVEA